MDRPKKETLTIEFKSDRAPLKLDDLYVDMTFPITQTATIRELFSE